MSRRSIIDEMDFPGASILQIIPSQDQGDFVTGTLDFSAEGARRRIEQGYLDAKEILLTNG